MTWTLYSLSSPVDGKIYKVDITQDVCKALIQHLQSDDENMLRLSHLGQLPRFNVLKRTESRSEAERFLREQVEKQQ